MDKIIANTKMKHSLCVHNKYETIKHALINHIRTIPGYELLYNDPEMVLWVCNVVENSAEPVDKKKPDKKELVMTIMTLCFNLQKDKQEAVEKTIEFLWSNKKIKKMSIVKKAGNYIYDWLQRKIL